MRAVAPESEEILLLPTQKHGETGRQQHSPTSTTVLYLWYVHSSSDSCAICCASSLVGDSTRTMGPNPLRPSLRYLFFSAMCN
jgi:hypothetical protein